jgi:hypothetical protein
MPIIYLYVLLYVVWRNLEEEEHVTLSVQNRELEAALKAESKTATRP